MCMVNEMGYKLYFLDNVPMHIMCIAGVLSRAPKNKNLTSKIYVVVQVRVDPTESN
jgi:hypothetical protein